MKEMSVIQSTIGKLWKLLHKETRENVILVYTEKNNIATKK